MNACKPLSSWDRIKLKKKKMQDIEEQKLLKHKCESIRKKTDCELK